MLVLSANLTDWSAACCGALRAGDAEAARMWLAVWEEKGCRENEANEANEENEANEVNEVMQTALREGHPWVIPKILSKKKVTVEWRALVRIAITEQHSIAAYNFLQKECDSARMHFPWKSRCTKSPRCQSLNWTHMVEDLARKTLNYYIGLNDEQAVRLLMRITPTLPTWYDLPDNISGSVLSALITTAGGRTNCGERRVPFGRLLRRVGACRLKSAVARAIPVAIGSVKITARMWVEISPQYAP